MNLGLRRVASALKNALTEPFPMDAPTQHRFLNGLDDIGITLGHGAEIDAFETGRPSWFAG